jgi:hypothetical protein
MQIIVRSGYIDTRMESSWNLWIFKQIQAECQRWSLGTTTSIEMMKVQHCNIPMGSEYPAWRAGQDGRWVTNLCKSTDPIYLQ